MNHGYARCSTNESKQDIDRQVRELKQAGAEEIFLEYEHGDSKVKLQQQTMLKNINRYIEKFTQKLADIGLDYATMSFQRAEYDGTNDVTVSIDAQKPNLVRVVASGKAVLFIEFFHRF